jgi:hypothetical protein
MDERRTRILVAIAGILGVVLLSAYFAAPFPQPPASATVDQIAETANKYSTLLLIGGWLQITGTMLASIFFIGLVYLSRAITRLSGMLTLFAAAVLLSTSLLEATLLMDVAYATANGHPQTALSSWDLMTMFIHIFPIGPASLSYLALGALLLGSSLLPRLFGYLALLLGIAFAVVGFLGLLVPAVNFGIIALLVAQELWILAAGITLLARRGSVSIPSGNVAAQASPGSVNA